MSARNAASGSVGVVAMVSTPATTMLKLDSHFTPLVTPVTAEVMNSAAVTRMMAICDVVPTGSDVAHRGVPHRVDRIVEIGSRVAEGGVDDAEEIRIERRLVEHLAADPVAPGEALRPLIVAVRIAHQHIEKRR